MDKRWLVGFIEGEGCFSLAFKVKRDVKYGLLPDVRFVITQDDELCIGKIAQYLQKELGISPVVRSRGTRENGKTSYEITVYRRKDVKKIAEWLANEEFETEKRFDFERWAKATELVNRPRGWRVAYSREELLEFAKLAAAKNNGKNTRTYTFEKVKELLSQGGEALGHYRG